MALKNKQLTSDLKDALENLPLKNNDITQQVVNLLHQGKRPHEIRKMLVDGTLDPGVYYSESQAQNIVYTVKKTLEKEFRLASEYYSADLFDKLQHLYERAYLENDYKECREILKDISKLMGVGQNQVTIAKQDEIINIQFN